MLNTRLATVVLWMAMVGCADKVQEEIEPSLQACPVKMPDIGSTCALEGTCLYADGVLALGGFECGQRELVCRDGKIGDTGMHCDPPPQRVTECPATMPPADTACSGALRCLYDTSGKYDAGGFDCSQQEYVCNDGVMKNSGLHCDPPPQLITECPATVPPADTACSGALRCLYDTRGQYDAGEFNCSQQEYVCNDGVMRNSGRHCDPM